MSPGPSNQRVPGSQAAFTLRGSPQLLGVSLFHLRAFFHELHVSVQQVQPPLRVALKHFKLILMGTRGWGGPGSRRWDTTIHRPNAPGASRPCAPRRSGFPAPPRRGAGGGRKLAGTPSPSREGPENRAGAPAGQQGLGLKPPRGVWNRAKPLPLPPTPLIPPRFRKIRPAWRESGPEGQGLSQTGEGGDSEWPRGRHRSL
jgi:hypothetical protein